MRKVEKQTKKENAPKDSSLPLDDGSSTSLIVRSDLNLEKWPIFSTSKCRQGERVFTRTEVAPNGLPIEQQVIITGPLRTFDLKVFYAAIDAWMEAGRPADKTVVFSFHKQAKRLNRALCNKTHNQIKESFKNLFKTTFQFINAWADAKGNKYMSTEFFRIFSRLNIFEKKHADSALHADSFFQFDEKIIANILQNLSKPVNLTAILSLKKEISILLYRRLDLMMAKREDYVRKTEELFKDLDLTGYAFPSKRKQLLEPAAKELLGAELSTGKLTEIKFEKTVDGSDWNIIFKKEPFRKRGEQLNGYEEIREPKESKPKKSLDDQVKEIKEKLGEKYNASHESEFVDVKLTELVDSIAKDKDVRNVLAVANYRVENN